MARRRRFSILNGIYHCMARGIDKKTIFHDFYDYCQGSRAFPSQGHEYSPPYGVPGS
jgi:hypothetical protein